MIRTMMIRIEFEFSLTMYALRYATLLDMLLDKEKK